MHYTEPRLRLSSLTLGTSALEEVYSFLLLLMAVAMVGIFTHFSYILLEYWTPI